jgi:hypothetical protein
MNPAQATSPIPNNTTDAGSGVGIKPVESTENWPLELELKLFKKPPGPAESAALMVATPTLKLSLVEAPNVPKSEL